MLKTSQRYFGYDHRELFLLEQKVKKRLNLLRMATDLKDFNYEAPQMYYDKQTGEIKMHERKEGQSKTLIKNMDELEREKKALYAEVGLDEQGEAKGDENEQ